MRTYLIWLVIVCLLPGIVGATALFIHNFLDGRARLEKDTLQTARALVRTVDGQLFKAQAAAQALSSAGSLVRKDFATFHRRATELLAETGAGTNIILSDKAGQQIVNTLRPMGEPLSRHANPALIRQVVATGKPVISSVYAEAPSHAPMVSIDVPVTHEGRVNYVLSIGIVSDEFNAILKAQGAPANWVVGIFDSTGTIVARTHSPEKYVGQKGVAELVQRIRTSAEGVMDNATREGIPVLTAYSGSPATGWSVGIGIPRQTLEAELVQSLRELALAVAGLFILGIGLAWCVGGKIARSVRTLTAPAVALGTGESAPRPQVELREAAEVAAAIERAAELLHARTTALQESNTSLLAKEAELAEAHHLAKFGNWHVDLKSGELRVSPEVPLICGRSVPPFKQQRGTLFTVESWDRLDAAMRETVRTGSGYDLELEVNHGNGGTIWLHVKCEAIRAPGGEVVALRGIMLEITERKLARERFRQQAMVFHSAEQGIVITDAQCRVIDANPAFERITEYALDEVRGKNMRFIQSGRHDQAFFQNMWRAITEKGHWEGEIWNRRKSGEIYLEWIRISMVRDDKGCVTHYVGTAVDISRMKHAQSELERMAHHDGLTDLPNRMLLISRLEHAIGHVTHHRGMGAVLFVDLDYFKQVNDTLGHKAGDELLQHVASRLKGRLREADTLARVGGDEFVIVLESIPASEAAAIVARDIICQLQAPFVLSGNMDAHIGGSVGIALFTTDQYTAEQLIAQADQALYSVKKSGKGEYRFFGDARAA